jgi:hypothetical protein
MVSLKGLLTKTTSSITDRLVITVCRLLRLPRMTSYKRNGARNRQETSQVLVTPGVAVFWSLGTFYLFNTYNHMSECGDLTFTTMFRSLRRLVFLTIDRLRQKSIQTHCCGQVKRALQGL